MPYHDRFKSCGTNVTIEDGVVIECPELLEVGDNVKFMRGFFMGLGRPRTVRIASDVTFYPNTFIQGDADRLLIDHHVDFFPNTYISLGGPKGFVEIGHHSHFAPNCVLYGHNGLSIGPYCNIAAHCVFATIGHDQQLHQPPPPKPTDGHPWAPTPTPMSLLPGVGAPITLVEDIWIAANSTIAAGVTIARGCIVGANSVVTRDTQPYGLYVGAPARRLRDRT